MLGFSTDKTIHCLSPDESAKIAGLSLPAFGKLLWHVTMLATSSTFPANVHKKSVHPVLGLSKQTAYFLSQCPFYDFLVLAPRRSIIYFQLHAESFHLYAVLLAVWLAGIFMLGLFWFCFVLWGLSQHGASVCSCSSCELLALACWITCFSSCILLKRLFAQWVLLTFHRSFASGKSLKALLP